jgi:hypothetical protein
MKDRKVRAPVEIVGSLEIDPSTGRPGLSVHLNEDSKSRTIYLPLLDSSDPSAVEDIRQRQLSEPVEFAGVPDLWAYRDRVVRHNRNASGGPTTREEAVLFLKHAVLSHETSVHRVRREVKGMENLDRVPSAQRERIPDSVRLFVWQRDEGKCVRCGSRELLEFDHIIPVAEGGSSTERNVQLLCEGCNRSKGRRV